MTANGKRFLMRCAVAILAAATSVFLRSLLTPLLGADVPFITLFPAVALSALLGGTGAGLLTTALGAIAVDFFIMPASALSQPKDILQLILFLTMGSFISWAIGERGRTRTRLQQIESESEQKKREAEEALRESEERSLLTQKSIGVGIWEWNLKTGEVKWSEGIFGLLGLEKQNHPTYQNWLDYILPDDREHATTTIQRLIDEGRNEFYDEFRLVRPGDGQIIWITSQGQIIRGTSSSDQEAGEALRLRGINFDITERKQAELEIKKLNHELNIRIKELQTIFDIAPVGIAVAHDADCNFISANPALAEMVGVKPGENVSVNSPENKIPYKHLKNNRELAAHELPMQRAVAEKRTILNEEIDILLPDGRLITIYGYAAPVFDEEGHVVSCVAAQIDITERKKNELERERKLDVEQTLRVEAEEANRLKDEFLATVSHELRTPLNAVIGWISILREDRFPGEAKERALEAIERGTKAQSQLIEDLLDVSRIISGKLQLDNNPVEIVSVIKAAVETVRPAAKEKDIELEMRLNPQIGLVSGDFDRLQQIVWNLLSNAIKFTPRGGRVEILLQETEVHSEIIVSDNGKGISQDFLPFVFDRFRQADGSITRHFTGLGLGLAIVRHLVELHGGTIGVESEGEGCGAIFRVSLPLMTLPELDETHPPHPNTDDGDRLQTSYPTLNDLRILIVDDDQNTREILKMIFEDCRAEVEIAATAREGFETVKKWSPQVIVSDIGMPDEDGYTFIQKVRDWEKERKNLQPLIQAVALTAYARPEDRLKALEAGFQIHIAKPVEPLELINVVANLMTSQNDPNKSQNRDI